MTDTAGPETPVADSNNAVLAELLNQLDTAVPNTTLSIGSLGQLVTPKIPIVRVNRLQKMNAANAALHASILSKTDPEPTPAVKKILKILEKYRRGEVIVRDENGEYHLVGSNVEGQPSKPLPEASAVWAELPIIAEGCDNFSDALLALLEWIRGHPNASDPLRKAAIKRVIRKHAAQGQIGAHATIGYIRSISLEKYLAQLANTRFLEIMQSATAGVRFQQSLEVPFGTTPGFTVVVSKASPVFEYMKDTNPHQGTMVTAWNTLCSSLRWWIALTSTGTTLEQLQKEDREASILISDRPLLAACEQAVAGTFLPPSIHRTAFDGSGAMDYLAELANLAAEYARASEILELQDLGDPELLLQEKPEGYVTC